MNCQKSFLHDGGSFRRRILSAFMLALFLLCSFLFGFPAQAEEENIYPQSVQITVEENGDYKISFEGELEVNERWVWFFCPDTDSAEDLLGVMRDAIEDETPVRGLTFDYMFETWPIHGTAGIPNVRVPAGSGYVFYGKAYCGAPGDPEQELYMMTLGGTNLDHIKPGEIGGNDLAFDRIIAPKTGDFTNLFLLTALLAAASLGLALLIKRNAKVGSDR